MSGVLDRMAKRALGALPTVQPLAPPQFAAPAAAWDGKLHDPETNLEIEAPAPRRKSVQSVAQEEVEDTSPHGKAESFQEQNEKPAPRMQQSFPQAENGETRDIQTVSPSSSDANAIHRPSWKREPAKEERGEKFAETKEFTRRSSKIEREDSEDDLKVETATPRAARSEKHIPSQAWEKSASEKDDHPLMSVRELQRTTTRPFSARRDAAAPVEQKTEIQISIGSIELRAPRVEARPQAQPFRPRVTLEDFLRRKPEAGA